MASAWEVWLELYTYGTGSSTQAAASTAGTGGQRFAGSLTTTQVAAVLAGLASEAFRATGSVSQAAAVIAAVARQDFRATGAVAQPPAIVMGSESERFIGQGSVGQSAPTLVGTGHAGAGVVSTDTGIVVSDSRRPLPPIPRDPYMPDLTGTGRVTQAVPTAAATGAVSDPDEWLLLVA